MAKIKTMTVIILTLLQVEMNGQNWQIIRDKNQLTIKSMSENW